MSVKVIFVECERGWGNRYDDSQTFPTKEEAIQFCREYNSKHNPPSDVVPDWYMYAKVEGQEQYGMLRLEDENGG